MQQLHREMELDCQRVELSWANEVALLSDREEGLEGVGHDDNLLMVGDHHHQAQGFSLMMQEASLQSFPSMIMMSHEEQAIRTPSTVLSLQTTRGAGDEEEEEEEEEGDEGGGHENADANVAKGGAAKKRGRQKGPGKPRAHYVKERESSFQMVLKLPLKSRKLFCVAEFYKYMSHSSSDSLCKVTEAYAKAGESVGVSGKTARKWVEDWERRADGTFSESQQGKHVKVEWLLQPEHLQRKARAWIEQNCPKKGDPPRKDSIIKMFRDFCNNDLLADVHQSGEAGADPVMSSHRRISTETARSWLHRLGFNNFKDFRRSTSKTPTT